MSEEFTITCDFPDRADSSSAKVEYGDFVWTVHARCSTSSPPRVTLSCEPTGNREALLWRCDTKAEIVAFEADSLKIIAKSAISHYFVFQSQMKISEYKEEYSRNSTRSCAVGRVEVKVKIFRNFCIDLSLPTNELVSGPSDAAHFEIDGRIVYLSKNILTRYSSFFAAMFTHDFLEKKTDSYTLREVDFHQVVHLMAIVHRKTAFIDASSVGYLSTLADFYSIREVALLCKNFLRADEEIDDREELLEKCGHFDQERLEECKTVEIQGRFHKIHCNVFELGAFKCLVRTAQRDIFAPVTGVQFACFPIDPKRSLLWRCVIQSEVRAQFSEGYRLERLPQVPQQIFTLDPNITDEEVECQHEECFSFHNCETVITTKKTNDHSSCNIRISSKLIESDIIDLSSSGNELIKDPEDAVCFKVDGEKLWFSKKVISLACPTLAELFKETKNFYVIDDISFTIFLHFMAILHSEKFEVDAESAEYLLKIADRFNCGYITDRCESFLRTQSGLSVRQRILLAERFNLIGLLMKLKS